MSVTRSPDEKSKGKQVSKKRTREVDAYAQLGFSELVRNLRHFAKTKEKMSLLAQRIRPNKDLARARREVNGALSSLPLEFSERLAAASMIMSDDCKFDLFFSLPDEVKLQYMYFLLGRSI